MSTTAGWIINRRSSSDGAFGSTSAHRGIRSPVAVSTSTTGESSASEVSRSVQLGSDEASASRPGTWVSNVELGLNPSLRFHSLGSIATPSVLTGRPSAGNATRPSRREAVEGEGSTHWRVSSGSQPSGPAPTWSAIAASVSASAGVNSATVLTGAASVVPDAAVSLGDSVVATVVAGASAVVVLPSPSSPEQAVSTSARVRPTAAGILVTTPD